MFTRFSMLLGHQIHHNSGANGHFGFGREPQSGAGEMLDQVDFAATERRKGRIHSALAVSLDKDTPLCNRSRWENFAAS